MSTSPASASTPSHAGELPVRTACNFCRAKKIRCDKVAVEQGGCSRCRKENEQCSYDVREPIGRPRKRKSEGASQESPVGASSPSQKSRSQKIKPEHGQKRRVRNLSQISNTSINGWDLSQQSPKEPGSISRWDPAPCCNSARSLMSPPEASSVAESMSATNSIASYDPSSSTSIDTLNGDGEAPSLSDLGLAAFLESLDTLEIKTEDGLTPNMLLGMRSGMTQQTTGAAKGTLDTDSNLLYSSTGTTGSQLSFGSALQSQASTSYAVPADLSWADPTWLLDPSRNLSTISTGPVALASKRWDEELTTPQAVEQAGPCPKTGKASCCCERRSEPANAPAAVQMHPIHESMSTRIHCVPNPSGRGCTCLCDASVALIHTRFTLRQAQDAQKDTECNGMQDATAVSTLQLTLSASQAVAAQCACSASCPTCRADPSTSLTASLLISTALQIYVRAVRTLRQGFGAEHEWSFGPYRPKPKNARRIAMYAMKLELRDLRDAIAKVSNAASIASCQAAASISSTPSGSNHLSARLDQYELNPIDQLIINKLHSQIADLLKTVESLADAENE